MALTQIQSSSLGPSASEALQGPRITNIAIADASWNVKDDTAITPAGGNIIINGSNFPSGSKVLIGSLIATSVTRVSTSELRVVVPAIAIGVYGTYNVTVAAPDGAVGVLANGLNVSNLPTWITGATLSRQWLNAPISIQLQASDATSYALQSGSSLPAGVTLAANGLISGTVTTLAQDTVYTFVAEAIDAQNQETPRTFSVNITVLPPDFYHIYAMGYNVYGNLGINTTNNRSSPVQVSSMDLRWSAVATENGDHVIAVKENGTMWVWGNNGWGQLGLNDSVARSSPVQLGALTNWSTSLEKVATGYQNSGAVKTDGTLWLWGQGTYGQLGRNSLVVAFSPIQVGSDTNWSAVGCSGQGSTFALKTNGTMWSWGENYQFNSFGGMLGHNDIVKKSSPVQIGSSTDWSKISVGSSNVLALKTNGTMWIWGSGYQRGEMGLNDYRPRSSPTQIGTATDWSVISAGGVNLGAIKTNGTLWIWGEGASGALGRNVGFGAVSSPVQIGSDTNWKFLAAGNYKSAAIRTDNTVWSWGRNDIGQLGHNNTVYKSSPVQVLAGVSWTGIKAGRNHKMVW